MWQEFGSVSELCVHERDSESTSGRKRDTECSRIWTQLKPRHGMEGVAGEEGQEKHMISHTFPDGLDLCLSECQVLQYIQSQK